MSRLGCGFTALAPSALLLTLAACRGGPEPIPLLGPAPRSIAVMPLTSEGLHFELRDLLDRSAANAIGARGYETVPPAVTAMMLQSLGIDANAVVSPESLARIGEDFDVDAVLIRTAQQDFGRSTPGAFRVEWLLLDIEGRRLWSKSETGDAAREIRRALTGPRGAYEDDPFFSDEPLVERSLHGHTTVLRTVTLREQVESVHARLAEALPRAKR